MDRSEDRKSVNPGSAPAVSIASLLKFQNYLLCEKTIKNLLTNCHKLPTLAIVINCLQC